MEIHVNSGSNNGLVDCRTCGGAGQIYIGMKTCGNCGGSGKDEYRTLCQDCSGKGCKKCENTGYVWKSSSCSDCGGTGQVKRFEKCPECNGRGKVSEFIECEFCGGEGGSYSTVHHDPTAPPDRFQRKIDIRLNGTVQAEKTVTFDLTTTSHTSNTWTKSGTHTEIWDVYADSDIGEKEVGSHIEGGNTKETPVTVIPATNLQVEFVEPNAPYRGGTEVVTTFLVRNQDNIGELNIRPRHNLTAEFQAVDPTTGAVIATKKMEGIVIPRQGTNLAYFKWRVPDSYSGPIKLQCRINTTKVPGTNGIPGVNETNYADNTATATWQVQAKPKMETPDTIFENRPAWFHEPSGSEAVPTDGITNGSPQASASYQVWEWDAATDWYVRNTYGASLRSTLTVIPDEKSPSRTHDDARNQWTMRSGYGVTLLDEGGIQAYGGSLPPASAMTEIQNANVYFPEYSYNGGSGKYTVLERTAANRFEHPQNRNTITQSGSKDYQRIHFVPLWYPDGAYKVKSYVYDCWTPAGMLSLAADAPAILIDGNMYEDHYVSHRD